jgi:hypothetical protein
LLARDPVACELALNESRKLASTITPLAIAEHPPPRRARGQVALPVAATPRRLVPDHQDQIRPRAPHVRQCHCGHAAIILVPNVQLRNSALEHVFPSTVRAAARLHVFWPAGYFRHTAKIFRPYLLLVVLIVESETL